MRLSRIGAAVAVALTACSISPSSGGTSPRPSAQPIVTSTAIANPSTRPSASSNPSVGPGGNSLVHCDAPVPAGDSLVIGSVGADAAVVVRDIQDPANAKTLCRFDPGVLSPQFVSAGIVAYQTSSNQLIFADLGTGIGRVVATFTAGTAPVPYAVSPDGVSITYLDGNAWHLITPPGVNKVLTTLPPIPARGFNPDEDDLFLAFSPDGQYIALVQTLHMGGSGPTAPDQVRKASDGTLVYSTSGMTMAVWASVPSRLFFRDPGGTMHRWDPSGVVSAMMPVRWIRPKSSPDGRWIAYTLRTSNVNGVGFYGVQSNSVSATSPPARSSARFLNNDLVWYIGEKACDTCFGGIPTPTGLAYIYSIAGVSEVVSRLSTVYDAWPRVTPPGV